MQRPHNDSSQMRAVLQPGDPSGTHSSSDRTRPSSHHDSSHCDSSPPPPAGVSAAAGTQRAEDAPSCCQLGDLRRLGKCGVRLELLRVSPSHAVLVDVNVFNGQEVLAPWVGEDRWGSNSVKMPCSPSSTVTCVQSGVSRFGGGAGPVSRWTLISRQLGALAQREEVDVQDVVDTILSYNPKYRDRWSFDALARFVQVIPKQENYFQTLFPKMAALALRLPDQVKTAVPLLRRGRSAAITLSQHQVSCLLANAFFCTFPHRNTSGPNTEYRTYPSINFSSLFGGWSNRKKEKLRAIMHYFHVVTGDETRPEGLVTFERRCLGDDPDWSSCSRPLNKLHVTSRGTIETDGAGLLQVDFASSWVGGGVLSSGLVQEEILFLMNPELIVSRLFTERLADGECLIVSGPQQFSRYSGFSDSFEWAGPHDDLLDRDEWGRLRRRVLAIDAQHFEHASDQYHMTSVKRELYKAYCGFKRHRDQEDPDIATGKWGCGAFKGDPQLKAVIQLMAAAKAGRGVAFFTFGDEDLERSLQELHHLLVTEGTTVAQLYGLLKAFCSRRHRSSMDLFKFLRKAALRSRSHL